jgi:hypothetical protein
MLFNLLFGLITLMRLIFGIFGFIGVDEVSGDDHIRGYQLGQCLLFAIFLFFEEFILQSWGFICFLVLLRHCLRYQCWRFMGFNNVVI